MKAIKHSLVIILFGISFFSYSQDEIDLLILNKNYKEALTEIETQLNKNPSAQLYFKKGLIFNRLQKYQAALKSYSEALQIEPDNTEVLSEMAEGLSILGNNTDAVNFYKKALEIEPDNLPLSGKLGRVYINQKKYKEAYEVFSRIYTKDSTNIYWNKQLAYCSFRTGERKQAVYLYENVLEVNPRDYGTYGNLIHSYNWKKEGSKIMVLIGKGLHEFPNDAELILERAYYFFRSKRYGPAMISFAKYLKIENAPSYEVLMNYGISTYFAGFEEDALETFNKLFTINPNDPLVMYYKSLCFKKLKNFEESEKMMQWAIDASIPDYVSDMYHHLGQILGQQRKFAESIKALQKANKLNPGNYEILFEIATTYEEFNSNKTLALNYYRLYLKEANESDKNVNYAFDRIKKIKEDLFFEE